MGHAAAGDGVGRTGGVAQEYDAGRDAGAGAALERRGADQLADLLGAFQARGEVGLRQGPVMKGALRRFLARLYIGEGCDEKLAIGQRRDVQLVARPDEDVHPGCWDLAGRQTEMGAHAEASSTRGDVQGQGVADGRVGAIRGHDQGSALRLAVNEQAYDAAILHERGAYVRAGVGVDAGGRCGGLEERLIQMPAPLAKARCGQVGDARETAFGDDAAGVVADAVKWRAANGLRQAETLQNGDAAGHESFAAGFFFGEFAALEQLDREPLAAEQNSQRRTCDSASGNGYVNHVVMIR